MKSCRREFIVGSVVGLVSTAFLPLVAHAAEELSETDPSAVALGYRVDATKVDKAKFAKYKPGETCANCQLYQGKTGETWGPCPIFSGKEGKACSLVLQGFCVEVVSVFPSK